MSHRFFQNCKLVINITIFSHTNLLINKFLSWKLNASLLNFGTIELI